MDGQACERCGRFVPYSMAMLSHAIEREAGKVLWLCGDCRTSSDVVPADRCDVCGRWMPRAGGQAAFATDAAGFSVEVFWACAECKG